MKKNDNQDDVLKASEPKRKSKQLRHGPEPERLKIEGGWVEAIDHSLKKKRPPEGWPK
jgi:hypothetical protein